MARDPQRPLRDKDNDRYKHVLTFFSNRYLFTIIVQFQNEMYSDIAYCVKHD